MAFSSREKFIHIFVVESFTAKTECRPIDWDSVHSMVNARCRHLSPNEIDEVMDDLRDEQLGCYIVEHHIQEIKSQKIACTLCDQEFLESDTLGKKQHEDWHIGGGI